MDIRLIKIQSWFCTRRFYRLYSIFYILHFNGISPGISTTTSNFIHPKIGLYSRIVWECNKEDIASMMSYSHLLRRKLLGLPSSTAECHYSVLSQLLCCSKVAQLFKNNITPTSTILRRKSPSTLVKPDELSAALCHIIFSKF